MRLAYRRRALENRGPFEQTGLLRRRDRAFPHGSRLPHFTGTGENQRLMVRHLVFDMLFRGASDFSFHACLVTLTKCQVVTLDHKSRKFKFAPRRLPQGIRGLGEPVEPEVVVSETSIPVCVPSEPNGLLSRLNPPFILAGASSDPTRNNSRDHGFA